MKAGRVDVLVGVIAAAVGATGAIGAHDAVPPLIGAVLGADLALVRRHTTLAWVVAAAALLPAVVTLDDLPFPVYVILTAHAFAIGRWAERVHGIAGIATLIAISEAAMARTHSSAVPPLLVLVTMWAAGHALRERAVIAERLAARVRELQDEREAYASLSVRYERARIASELHDIVAHAISVMVVQATAGQRLVAQSPELTDEAFAAIAEAARHAKADMGRLVDLLADEDAPRASHDIDLVRELVERAAGSGLDVTLRVEGDPQGLPGAALEAVYRVVQESLTNALRYAAGAPVRVVLTAHPHEVAVDVANAAAGRSEELAGIGTGHGLRGLRERVGACGGTLEAGPSAGGGWRVCATLPRRVAMPPVPGSP